MLGGARHIVMRSIQCTVYLMHCICNGALQRRKTQIPIVDLHDLGDEYQDFHLHSSHPHASRRVESR